MQPGARIDAAGERLKDTLCRPPPCSPDTAPFAQEHIAALNSVISVTTAEQRAWLSGYLAGLQAANGSSSRGAAAPPAKRVPLTILFGTESGNAEALAAQARKAAPNWDLRRKWSIWRISRSAQAAATENLLIVASTWGEGDPPQRAVDFFDKLMTDDAPRFDKTRFAVLALGDRAYAQFCEIGRKIDERLAALGGARIAERIECDLDFETPATGWIDSDPAASERRGRDQGCRGLRHPCRFRPARRRCSRPAPARSRRRLPSTYA